MIVVVCWSKCKILVLKLLTLVVELRVLLFSHWPSACFNFHWQLQLVRNAHNNSEYNAMIAVMCCHLHAETHPGGEVVSTVK